MVSSLALMTGSPLAGTLFSFLPFAMLVLLGSRSRESIRVYLLARSMSSLDLGLSPWATVLQEEPLMEALFLYSTVGTS